MVKIVIDIEEGRYNCIMSHASNDPGDYVNSEDLFLRKAIESGTVLPKGHGDLIDRSALKEEIIRWFNLTEVNDRYWWNRVKAIIDNMPSISSERALTDTLESNNEVDN